MSWNDLRKGRYSNVNFEYFVTFNTHHRVPYFKNFYHASLFCQQIAINQSNHKCTWLTWILMPDHFHGLVRLESDSSDLSTVVGALKGRSAYILNKHMKSKGKLWQAAFYDRALRSEEDRKNIARYIVANPLRRGLVKSVKDYSFWDSVYL